jgi:beta-N-acetylhexosaminidase
MKYKFSRSFVILIFLLIPLFFQASDDIKSYVQTLSLDQKIGQLFIATAVVDESINGLLMLRKQYRVDKEYIASLISDYHIGGIIWLGNSLPSKQKERTQFFQEYSKKNNGIPLWFAQDLEPSFMERFGLPFLLPASSIGERDDLTFTESIGAKIGTLARDLGVHIALAPVADLHVPLQDSPITKFRSFGTDPEKVALQIAAFTRGIMSQKVIACAKHFPGHGHTTEDSHYDLPQILLTKNELKKTALVPFDAAIKEGVEAVMTGHLVVPAYDQRPATLSFRFVTYFLKNKLDFKGLVITDALDMKALATFEQKEVKALEAGCDILLCCPNIPQAVVDIKNALERGKISMHQLDKSVCKIMAAKRKVGLL